MVSVLGHSVEAGEEGRAERAQTEHGLGQAAGLGLDGAGDVHLERTRKEDCEFTKIMFSVVIICTIYCNQSSNRDRVSVG